MNILLVDWHEPFLFNFSQMGHTLYLIEPKVLGLKRIDKSNTWQEKYRPIPLNANLLSTSSELKQGLREGRFDVAVALNYYDLPLFKHFPVPKIYFPIAFYRDDFSMYERVDPEYHTALCNSITQYFPNYFLAFQTDEIKQKEMGTLPFQCYRFKTTNGIPIDAYSSYTGELPQVLRVVHRLRERSYYNYELHATVLQGVPHLVLGENKGLPNSRSSTGWDDLLECLKTHRVFFATYSSDYALPDPTSQLEAMGVGMPVVTTPHPKSLIVDGFNGFVSADPKVLREKLELLLNDHELAKRLGENARRTVREKYNFEKFTAEWEIVFKKAIDAFRAIELAENGDVREWVGPFYEQEPFASYNRNAVLHFSENETETFPVPVVTSHFSFIEPSDVIECLSILERLGQSFLRDTSPREVVFSPFDLETFQLKVSGDVKRVCILQWEYGALPTSWVNALKADKINEVWVNSDVEGDAFEAQGIPGEKLHVIRREVDLKQFSPVGSMIDFDLEERFVFLYVGGLTLLDSADVLLNAYIREFKSTEKVKLLIVSVTRSEKLLDNIQSLKKIGNIPSIDYFYAGAPHLLNRIFRVSSLGIFPYRGLGLPRFLPEMLACGIPVIVNGYGAALDLQSWGSLHFIPATVRFLSKGDFKEELTGEPFIGEPNEESLRKMMRFAFQNQKGERMRGLLARHKALSWFQWGTVSRKKRQLQEEAKFDKQLIDLLALYEAGQANEAIECCERMLREKESPIAYAMLGLLLEGKETLASLEAYENATELDPSLAYLNRTKTVSRV